jgi:hypothetical protein
MTRLVLTIISAVVIIAVALILFIKILPWVAALLASVAFVKFCHDWLIRQGIIPAAWWPWKQGGDPQNAA